GKPIKRKCRICGKGFRQIKGIDYHNSYAPVIHADVLRMCFCVSAELGLEAVQFDFHAAFLHAPNDVEMYVECPPGYQPQLKGDVVLALKKVIYGMKQSAHRFYKLISGDFLKLGFKQSKSSHCLFVKCYGSENRIALLVLHVDDGGYFAKDMDVIEKDLTMLRRKYKLDHEPMNWYVGLRIVKQDGSIGMVCDAYIEQCAKRFGMDKMAPQTHPATVAPVKHEGESTCRKRFMELVGCLLYISTACRPEITAATNMLASHMANPSQKHLTMAEGVLCYLLSTKSKGLKFNRTNVKGKSHLSKLRHMKLEGFFDSDFADDQSRKSRTGFVIYYNGNVVSWVSKLQSLCAQSVFEAETIAGNEAFKTIKFLRKIVADLSCGKEPMGIVLHGDNEKSIECAKTGVYGKRSKHF
ncbi:MAG: reverse transcriptase domain-containing protein, partial [Myxococcota bacterium]